MFVLVHKDTLKALATAFLLLDDSNLDNKLGLEAISLRQREFRAKKLNELKQASIDSYFKKKRRSTETRKSFHSINDRRLRMPW